MAFKGARGPMRSVGNIPETVDSASLSVTLVGTCHDVSIPSLIRVLLRNQE